MVDIIPWFSLPAYFMPAAEIQQRVAPIYIAFALCRAIGGQTARHHHGTHHRIKKQGSAPAPAHAFVHGIINTAIFTDKTQVKLTADVLQKFARAVLRNRRPLRSIQMTDPDRVPDCAASAVLPPLRNCEKATVTTLKTCHHPVMKFLTPCAK